MAGDDAVSLQQGLAALGAAPSAAALLAAIGVQRPSPPLIRVMDTPCGEPYPP